MIKVDADGLQGDDLRAVVDADIEEFNRYFQNELGNSSLIAVETAALRTYLYYKLIWNKPTVPSPAP